MPEQKVDAAQKRTGKRYHGGYEDQGTKVRAHRSAPQSRARIAVLENDLGLIYGRSH
jgi:hypothetical protein